jgi:spermidine synthase
MSQLQIRCGRSLLVGAFTLSGLSGLVYESIWTHYIKLFLGHAAYAQTLVLAIFMGGMAFGSWFASRQSARWANLLAVYALVEGLIGICGLLFHGSFVRIADLTYDQLLPSVGSTAVAHAVKWTLAAGFILPQSLLLGMTFPLMSGAFLRRFPQAPGASLATLYFANSIGAAVGVLASGFWLIKQVGLPGTIQTAGLINVVLGLFVWLICRDETEARPPMPARTNEMSAPGRYMGLMLMAAFVTGAASFLYEIAWIRGLSLVLGSSTHSFELMLSAFILGLAFGGLWVRGRIDRIRSPAAFLGRVQVIMGLLALATLSLFNSTFDLMQAILSVVPRTAQGYAQFHIASHALCLLVMLPATFCAGTTLPLMTYLLLRRGEGERAIGLVYAANTLGAIFGVLVAVHVLIEPLGIKGVIWVGAALDMGVGLLLLAERPRLRAAAFAAPALVTVLALASALAFVSLDQRRLASGVYRYGDATLDDSVTLVYLKHGKTATVSLAHFPDGTATISTNGKPDAGVQIDGGPPSSDEQTMVLAGALGIISHPEARTAAIIGFGSGLTSHVMLSTPQLDRLDTIEIEPRMVEAARGFGARVAKAFTDPRSHVYIEDAKTFFSTHQRRYDLIVSEPSNPWVSGVSSLFSQEFYRRTANSLAPHGLFLQWVQLYEIDPAIMASIMKALGSEFSDYVAYKPVGNDLLILATKQGKVPPLQANALSDPGLAREMARVNIMSLQELQARRVGSKCMLDSNFQSYPVPVNSDYFPFVDQNAERARFLAPGLRSVMKVSSKDC